MSYTPYTGPEGDEYTSDGYAPEQVVVRQPNPLLDALRFVGLALLFVAVLSGVLWLVSVQTSDPTKGLKEEPAVGSLAPDFELVDVRTGEPVKLSSLRGKGVWINFWATWCPPCQEEMPEMQQLYTRYREKGLVILGVDVQEPQRDVLDFIDRGGFEWTFVIDPKGDVTNRYMTPGLPLHLFVDKHGIIRAIHLGPLESSTGERVPIEESLKKILP